ncbi:DNA cytosine methyltransferase [Pantoea deleyi]|uniref:Cytosine-specific methyltransferase n=1 Tax=Pantoea deleyi TaxID=470932 RepID=A0A506QPI4_9GAMM|nr:DNA cytosine methyltransferase [Pantoea deleyi]TPV47446.1 DNA cytosine methyltransferase [Pantoea deleyi]
MKNKRLTVASLFCGIGGLDLGFEWAGYEIIWANDIAKAAIDSYPHNFNRVALLGDINELSINTIPDTDIIIGGPPCQSFSLVGQRRPDDQRGQLVYRYVEIIRAKKPRAFVMENVPGMAASNINGKRLPDILVEEFMSLGYTVSVMKLDASNYLVPQKRRRIFLVGVLDANFVMPTPSEFAKKCYGIDISNYDNGAAAAIGDLGDPVPKGELANYQDGIPSEFSKIMRNSGLQQVSLHENPRMSDTDMRLLSFIPPGGNYQNVPDEYATGRILNFKKSGGRTTTYARLHPEKPSYTVNTYFRRPNVGSNFHYEHNRLITAREAMRFQSIPDHFVAVYSSQDARNALIGNAVPPLLAHAVAWGLKNTLEDMPSR